MWWMRKSSKTRNGECDARMNRLVIVTDLGLLKAYRYGLPVYRYGLMPNQHDTLIEPIEQVVLREGHRRVVDIVTDFAGRRAAPTQKSWAAPVSDPNHLILERERRIVKLIAGHISRLIRQNERLGCWLAADVEINHQIIEKLPSDLRAHIKKNLPRDLVKLREPDLIEQFLAI